jgi:hypothetical protein
MQTPMRAGPVPVGTREGWEEEEDGDLWNYQTERFREWRLGLSKKTA